MNFTIDTLLRARPTVMPLQSLAHAQRLHALLNYPGHRYPTIHIAGSNGKGSVATKIASVLARSGYRVGLYTSPHLYCVTERITINFQPILKEVLEQNIQTVYRLDHNSSFFELLTFAAFEYFVQEKVDVAVVEVGIGGRFDATNVVNPALAVITSISQEHTQLLGKELVQIAVEKGGILKPGVPLILGPHAMLHPIVERATALACPLYTVREPSLFFDDENTRIAHLALESLAHTFQINPEALACGLRIRPPCRFEACEGVVFDVAHNPDAIVHLISGLRRFYPQCRWRFLIGFSEDKDWKECLIHIAKVATHIHLIEPVHAPKAASVAVLAQECAEIAPFKVSGHLDLAEGARLAWALARRDNELLVVCGSFYIMAEVKQALAPSFSPSTVI